MPRREEEGIKGKVDPVVSVHAAQSTIPYVLLRRSFVCVSEMDFSAEVD